MQPSSDTDAPRALLFLRPAAELTLKSNRTRWRFQKLLVGNVEAALRAQDVPFRFQGEWGWFLIETEAPLRAIEVLRQVPGLGPIMPVELVTGTDLEEIVERGAQAFAERVRGRRFAVRARERGHQPYGSRDIEVALGAALRPQAERVDLDNPDVTVHVEVRDDRAYFYTTVLKGAGGLPVGSQGRALVLISGGFDSAVAAWLVLRRGVAVDYLLCNLGGKAYERAVLQVAKVLADGGFSAGSAPRFYSVDFGPVVEALQRTVRPAYWQVALKRLMYRAGEGIAARSGALALVTGEALGQVSSQTLKNLGAIEAGGRLPVLRPLIGHDKEQIIDWARRIGTATLSARVREYCALTPRRPVTGASARTLDAQLAGFDPAVLDRAVAEATVWALDELSPQALATSHLFVDEIPEGAEIIDCQTEGLWEHWHYPGARHFDPWVLLKQFKQLDRERVYVLYCQRGLQSAYVAEVMQREGYEAYAFRGGLAELKAHARARGIPVVEL